MAQPTLLPGGLDRGRLFSLPRSQDDIYEWTKAREEVAAGQVEFAVERLYRLLGRRGSGVVPADPTGERYLGLRMAVISTLRDLPAEGRAAYERLTRREASSLLRQAFESDSREALRRLAERFPASRAGLRARLRLGDLALEAGRGIAAELHYRAARDSLPAGSPLVEDVDRRRAAAAVLTATLHGETPYPDVAAQIREALPAGAAASGGWPAYGGGGDGRRPMQPPLGRPEPRWQFQIPAIGFDQNLFPMHAVGGQDGLYINDGLSVWAFDALTETRLWKADGPMADAPVEELADYRDAINLDMALAAAYSERLVVAALQVPTEGQSTRFRHIDVIKKIPARRLFAFDRATGKLVWSHWDRPGGPVTTLFAGHDAAGPPLIYGDSVLVPSHDQTGAIAFYLTAYDLATGRTKWRRLICSSQGEVNMFGNANTEFAAAPLAVLDGVVYGCTNLGVCFAADAADGEIRWVSAYEVIELPPTRLTGQHAREVFFANSPVVVADGVMACTPLDSAYALGFDAATGKPLWRLYYRTGAGDLRWLLGAIGDEFVFSGLGVVAVKSRPRDGLRLEPRARIVRTPESLGLARGGIASVHAIPRGALTEDRIYYVSPQGLRVFDIQGNTDPSIHDLPGADSLLGNLLLVDGLLVALRRDLLSVHYDEARLLQAAERAVARDPQNLRAILRYASLLRARAGGSDAAGFEEAAERLFRRGLAVARSQGVSPGAPVYRRLAGELFEILLRRGLRIANSSRSRALELFSEARELSSDRGLWIRAQLAVLDLLRDDPRAQLRELDRMAERYGDLPHRLPGAKRPVPIAAWAWWRGLDLIRDPAAVVERCQDLLERYPGVVLDGRTVREAALERQRALIARHGRSVYTAIEKRAQAAMAEAGGDADALRAVASRYPLARAAREALLRLLDLAVERGDLGAAAAAFARSVREGSAGAGVYRRMLEAATRAGNFGLARELAKDLIARFGEMRSDYRPDGGRKLKDAVQVPPPPADSKPDLAPPLRRIAELRATDLGASVRACGIERPDGFASPAALPLYVSVRGEELLAYDLQRGAEAFTDPLFQLGYAYPSETEKLLVCGNVLVLPEMNRVRGVDYRSGEGIWSFSATGNRMLISLGVRGGVLHLFSELRNAGDGGVLIGLEPLSGTLLFRQVFPVDRESIPPVSAGDSLWMLAPGGENPGIDRIDPVTGAVVARVPLHADLLRRLHLDRRRLQAHTLHYSLFADEHAVYLPVDGDGEPPRLAALSPEGRELWTWTGMRDRTLAMASSRGGLVVLVESDARGSRALLLEGRSGSLRREFVLGHFARPCNWSRTWRHEPAPDAVVIFDTEDAATLYVTCLSLRPGLSSFRHALHGAYQNVENRPLVGKDFFVIPARRREDGGLALLVLDLGTRRSLLGHNKSAIRFEPAPPYRVLAWEPFTIVESSSGIVVLGNPKGAPR